MTPEEKLKKIRNLCQLKDGYEAQLRDETLTDIDE